MKLARTFLALAMVCCCGAANALSVLVLDPAGHGVADVVVVVKPRAAAAARAAADRPHAQMDQRNREFVPHILVIEAGTWVDFPNNDTVSHQVYSFSPAKRFQLPLYKGAVHPPVLFDQPGVVTLGCNIHDNMLGYIFVADSPWFGMTDSEGRWANAGLPAGSYDVSIWSPRFREPAEGLRRTIDVSGAAAEKLTFRITRRPKPERGQPAESAQWDDY